MSLFEIDHIFDEGRQEFAPYGLTCERWRTNLMGRPDHHNEIELNLLQSRTVTYLLRGKRHVIRPHRLTIFWALAPHQIIEMEARLRRLALTSTMTASERTKMQPVEVSNPSKVEQMAIFIASNYRDLIQVKEIAEAVDLHPDYATALFKKTFGITLSDYLTDNRISHAQRMLAATQARITDIAYESGYNSISRFNASFKKSCGCTPRQYRKQHGLS